MAGVVSRLHLRPQVVREPIAMGDASGRLIETGFRAASFRCFRRNFAAEIRRLRAGARIKIVSCSGGPAVAPILRLGSTLAFLAVIALPRVSLGDVNFIRGDANGDGRISISDAYRIVMWWWGELELPQCRDAADADDNGRLEGQDIAYIVQAQFSGGTSIPPPFPEPGQDPTDDLDGTLGCDAYGGGEGREDPAFELKVLDGVAQGGDESVAFFQIALTSPAPIGAWSGRFRFPGLTIRGRPGPFRTFHHDAYFCRRGPACGADRL